MKKLFWAGIILLNLSGIARAQDKVLQLTLKEAIKSAVEKNLDVQAELYNPASADADIHKYQGIYDPLLSFLVGYQDSSTQPANTFLTGGEEINRQRSLQYNAAVSQLIPTGGTLGLAFNNSWNHNNSTSSPGAGFQIMNNYFNSDLTLSFTQPLLRNFGRENVELNIDAAKSNREGTIEQFKSKLLDIIGQVETQYFQLYSLRQNLDVKKTSLKLAQTILDNTQAQVKAGVLPAYEILNAQFGVATQQKNLIDAERALKDQVDVLRHLLQLDGVTDIVPVDTPYKDEYVVNESKAIGYALADRPDLMQQKTLLATNELQARVARNQILPQLDLTSSAAFTGLENRYNSDLERVGSGRYPIWNVGVQFSYPIGNDSARNDYIKSRLKVAQTQTQIKNLEDSISNDVRTSIRAVRSGYLQLDVTKRGREYADAVLQAFIKKQKVGLATTKDVLDELNNSVTAQGNEIQAVTDYNNALVALWKSTGELLQREGITLGGKEADTLYDKFN